MRKLNLNFDQFSKQVLTVSGDVTSEKLLKELPEDMDLTLYIVIDVYSLTRRSSYKSELEQLLLYLEKGIFGKVTRLRRGCTMEPISVGPTFKCLKLKGFGREMYLVSRDEYLELLDNVKKFATTSKKGSNK